MKASTINPVVTLVCAFLLGSALLITAAAQETPRTDEDKIADAMRAGPASITENATIMDWPSSEGEEMSVLREGTNGWVCYPSNPAVLGLNLEDPMCLDEVWQGWVTALLAGDAPVIEGVGIAYMLRGDGGASNIDPFATGPTEDNDWHVAGPHIMILAPDLSAFPTDYQSGGPYVMWAGTPYAHIMVPLERHMQE